MVKFPAFSGKRGCLKGRDLAKATTMRQGRPCRGTRTARSPVSRLVPQRKVVCLARDLV